MPSRNATCFHVDTNYLIDCFRWKHGDTDERAKIASGVINEAIHHGKVRASVTVIGEFVDVVVRKRYSLDLLNDLADYIERGKLEVCYVEPQRAARYTDLSLKIRKEVRSEGVGSTDVFILAHMMTDMSGEGLLTFDDAILTSRGVQKVLKEHIQNRKRPRITDDPRRS